MAEKILANQLITPQTGAEGVKVNKLLVTDGVDIEKEYYVGMVVDRHLGPVLMASSEGGVEIEEVARVSPEKILKEPVDVDAGLYPFQARRLAYKLGFKGNTAKTAAKVMTGIASAFIKSDCAIAEINPLVLTKDLDVIAIDAKIVFDDNAVARHPKLEAYRDNTETHESEVRAKKSGLSYIRLDGNIACMVNGAGLAMATMDIIKGSGGTPANFLDVGGGAKKEQVVEAFNIILSDPRVKAILVNIFGGIAKCDVIAEGIVHATQEVNLSVPLVVRLEGTNVDKGKEILANSPLKIITASGMKDAAEKVVAAAKGAE